MSGATDVTVEFIDRQSLDSAAWDAHVIATSGNPTQLAAFGGLGGAARTPVYAQLRRGPDIVLRWLFYRTGLAGGLSYLDIRSEPTSQDPAWVGAVLRAAVQRFKPFRIVFDDIVCNRWQSSDALTSLGFDTLNPHGTVALDLRIGWDALRAGMQKRRRNRVNRGPRDGLFFEEQSDAAAVARLYPLVQQTLASGGAATPRFEHVLAHAQILCFAGIGRLFFATRDGIDYGAIFDFVTPKLALGWLGGTRADAPASTGCFLQWSVIERLSAEGVATYDLGGVDTQAPQGSKGARIRESKQRYGGLVSEHCGGTRTRGPVRAALYDRMMRLRRGA